MHHAAGLPRAAGPTYHPGGGVYPPPHTHNNNSTPANGSFHSTHQHPPSPLFWGNQHEYTQGPQPKTPAMKMSMPPPAPPLGVPSLPLSDDGHLPDTHTATGLGPHEALTEVPDDAWGSVDATAGAASVSPAGHVVLRKPSPPVPPRRLAHDPYPMLHSPRDTATPSAPQPISPPLPPAPVLPPAATQGVRTAPASLAGTPSPPSLNNSGRGFVFAPPGHYAELTPTSSLHSHQPSPKGGTYTSVRLPGALKSPPPFVTGVNVPAAVVGTTSVVPRPPVGTYTLLVPHDTSAMPGVATIGRGNHSESRVPECHLRLGGCCEGVPPVAIAHFIELLSGVRVAAVVFDGRHRGLARCALRNPIADRARITHALHKRAWMAPDALYWMRAAEGPPPAGPGTASEHDPVPAEAAALQSFVAAVGGTSSVRCPTHLLTCTAWSQSSPRGEAAKPRRRRGGKNST